MVHLSPVIVVYLININTLVYMLLSGNFFVLGGVWVYLE